MRSQRHARSSEEDINQGVHSLRRADPVEEDRHQLFGGEVLLNVI